jgi:RimJ/RimL family protein N-acetyltransferase
MTAVQTAVRLVAFDRRYLDLSWEWLRDPEIKRLTLSPDFTRDQQLAFFAGLPGRSDYRIWGAETLDGEPIGAIGIKHIADGQGEVWCYIGARQQWGRGLGSQMLALCEQQARGLGIARLTMTADDGNMRSIRAFERQGYSLDDRRPPAGLVRMSKAIR